MKNKYLLCVPLCFIAIIARIKLTTDIDVVMALINIVALLFVIYFAYRDTISIVDKEIENIVGVKQTIQRYYRNNRLGHGILTVIMCTIILSVYICWFVDPKGNDAISIIALGLSVISDEISDKWSQLICRRIRKKSKE